jgi:hypothetical protein
MGRLKPREYTRGELVEVLRQYGPRLAKERFQPCPSLDDLIHNSVGGNTFRSFRGLTPPTPSVIFREWASARLPSSIPAMAAVRD